MASASPELSILVVSYNTRDMTLACLASVAEETTVTAELIVVDNASTDGSAEAIAEHASRPKLIASPVNLGFARANNRAAAEAKGAYILLLNPDTLIRDGAIDKLVAFARRTPEAQIWGGRTVFADGSLNATANWRRLTIWALLCRATGLTGLTSSPLFNPEAYGGWQRDSEREVDIVTGCFLLVRRDLWERLGGFDPTFFMYGEEGDFCLRARALGARPRFTPAATIVHYGGASEPTREGKMVKVLAAKATLIRRHLPRGLKTLGVALNAAWPFSRSMAYGAAAQLTGNSRVRAAAATWWGVWARRQEWLGGYDRTPDATSPMTNRGAHARR